MKSRIIISSHYHRHLHQKVLRQLESYTFCPLSFHTSPSKNLSLLLLMPPPPHCSTLPVARGKPVRAARRDAHFFTLCFFPVCLCVCVCMPPPLFAIQHARAVKIAPSTYARRRISASRSIFSARRVFCPRGREREREREVRC